ncbi:pyridoxal kinase PdxY [Neoaquamicrobium sediminum]|uniref:pyridoxal kinase PdxY n=1 Tax=Neoaquamicrobium sediminum TaxID=1849104 RepID=UPI00156565F9|nr:pyridoxal kinase PdxY [Mesorhizobium sediminum]NRC53841.1 pyridoxal kinase PdxY [Mesorhizobium sediminum]
MTSEGPGGRSAVIVVSSHVARGAVGNRAAVFALQQLGFPVWAVPTVVLPWHPGHGAATRIVPDPDQFAALVRDLESSPWIGEVGAVLSGYLGDADQAVAVASLVSAVKARNPEALYLCDPVMGDAGGLYVPEATAAAMRDLLMPLADIATPNRFELEWLAGETLGDNRAIGQAALRMGPSRMLVTSAHALMAGSIGNLLVTPREMVLAEHRSVPKPPNGTGDLAAALFLARLMEGRSAEKALQITAASVFEVVARAVKRQADELMLETDAQSLVHPMAMVQMRRLVHPDGERRA